MTNDLVIKVLKNLHYTQRSDENKYIILHTELGFQYTSNYLIMLVIRLKLNIAI